MAFNPYETFDALRGRYKNADERRSKLGGTFDDYANGVTRTVEIPEDMRYKGGDEEGDGSEGFETAAMTAEEVRDKFNLDYNEDHAKLTGSAYSEETGGDGFTNEGAIFTEDGEYVGSIDADADKEYYAGFSDLTNAASDIKKKAEGKGFTNVNSLSDVAGAVHWLTKGGEAAEKEIDPDIPETMDVTYKLSEHAQKAVERVKNYQEKRDTGYYNDMFSAGRQSEAKADDNHVQPDAYAGGGANAANFKAMDLDAARNSGFDAERFKRDHSKTTSWGDEARLYRG